MLKRSWMKVPAMVAFLLVLSACGGGSGSGNANGGGGGEGGASAEELDLEATLRVAYPGAPDQLDPHLESNLSTKAFTFLFYDRLLMLDENREIVPGLAESWEFSADGTSLTLVLRDDATFTDGSTIDAEAIKASLDRAITLPGSTQAGQLASVEEVTVVDPTTVRLELSQPDVTLLTALSTSAGAAINPVAIEDGRDLGSGPDGAGSGAYELQEFVPQEKVVATRSDRDYWDPDAAKVREFDIRAVSAEAAVQGVQSGDFDLAYPFGTDLESLRGRFGSGSGTTLHEFSSELLVQLYLRNTRPATEDLRVRQAIAHAVDWQTIAENVVDSCEPTYQWVREGNPGYLDEPVFDLDPGKAEDLLADAGATGTTVTVAVGDPASQRVAEAIQEQLEPVGIDLEVQTMPSITAARQAFSASEVDGALVATGAEPTPERMMQSVYLNVLNLAGPDDAEIRGLIDETIDPTLDEAGRDEALREALTFGYEKAWALPVCFTTVAWLAKDTVHNVDVLPWAWGGFFDFRYIGVGS